jgi:hypothetical protein
MPRASTCVRSRRAIALIVLVAIAFARAGARADDAAAGYAAVRPSLVKVWAFDVQGHPVDSGSGFVIVSNASRSLVLTAEHVVASAASITIDIDRDRHDIPAHVQQRGPRDLAVLLVDRGGLTPATFAPRSRAVVEGNLIAVAGFVKHDELIGVVGQEPRLLYPGTISSRPDDGAYLELENVHIEEGLSGGPVFDPDTGEVLGIVTSRTSDQRGGFADSADLVVLPFLAASAIAYRVRGPRIVALAPASPAPKPSAPAKPAVPSARATPKFVALPTAKPLVVLASMPRPSPSPTTPPVAVPRMWDAHDDGAHRIAYDRDGCAIVLSLAVERLVFGESTSDARLTLRVARRVAPVAACADVAESNASDGAYRATASSFDGRHLTVRFHYAADDDANAADAALFPADVSLDADLDTAPVTAHMQLMDTDWDDVLDVTASKDR